MRECAGERQQMREKERKRVKELLLTEGTIYKHFKNHYHPSNVVILYFVKVSGRHTLKFTCTNVCTHVHVSAKSN